MRTHLLLLTLGIAACEPMESRGNPFAAAPRPTPTGPAAAAPGFDFPEDPPLVISSEQMAQGDSPASLAAAAGVDANALVPAEAAAAPAPVAAPALTAALPVTSGWPVRLVSTIPQAQPPRAILGLPSGEERVVSPGSMLAEQGLVVMMVTADKVQLARVEAAGDHARIETIELSAQYPTP